jgi:hypothetical protein
MVKELEDSGIQREPESMVHRQVPGEKEGYARDVEQ